MAKRLLGLALSVVLEGHAELLALPGMLTTLLARLLSTRASDRALSSTSGTHVVALVGVVDVVIFEAPRPLARPPQWLAV